MLLPKLRLSKHSREIFNNISDMIFIISVGEDGLFYYEDANTAAIHELDLPKDFIGKPIQAIMPTDAAEIITKNYQRAIEEKGTVSYAAPFIHKDGNERLYESKVTPIFNQKGECKRIISVTRDMTSQTRQVQELDKVKRELEITFTNVADPIFTFDKKGECKRIISVTRDMTSQTRQVQELDKVKRELEITFTNVADPIFTFDKKGHYIKINPGFTNLFGWTAEELLHNPSLSIVPENNKEEFKKILQSLKNGTVTKNLLTECVAKDGRTIKVLASYSPLMDNGEWIGGVAVYKDVTQMQDIQNQLDQSNQRFHYIAEHSSDLVRVVDRDGKVLVASPSHKKLLGIPPEFYLNKSYLTLVHPDDMNRLKETFETIIRTKSPQSVEYRRFDHTKKPVWLGAVGTPFFDTNGEVESVLFIARDIRETKEKESTLEFLAYHDTLTNLPNRRLFEEHLAKAMKESIRLKKITAVFVLDCDHFKRVNDTYGHEVGDQVIQRFAERIKSNLRENDMVSRMGGDEFQVVLSHLETEKDAEIVAQRIIKTMETPFLIGDLQLKLTTSIGIAFYNDEKKQKRTLLREADQALYDAKRSGKNTYHIYKTTDDQRKRPKWWFLKRR